MLNIDPARSVWLLLRHIQGDPCFFTFDLDHPLIKAKIKNARQKRLQRRNKSSTSNDSHPLNNTIVNGDSHIIEREGGIGYNSKCIVTDINWKNKKESFSLSMI